MKEMLKMVGVLTLICGLSGYILAYTNRVTQAPIEASKRKETLDALKRVLPPCDNEPDRTVFKITESGRDWSFYVARSGKDYVGTAFITASSKGYSGLLEVLVGVKADGAIGDIEILTQHETPGLGTKISDPANPFRLQFPGRSVASTKWKLKKDGGDLDGITGATISSRAVAEAMAQGLEVYDRHRAEIEATGR